MALLVLPAATRRKHLQLARGEAVRPRRRRVTRSERLQAREVRRRRRAPEDRPRRLELQGGAVLVAERAAGEARRARAPARRGTARPSRCQIASERRSGSSARRGVARWPRRTAPRACAAIAARTSVSNRAAVSSSSPPARSASSSVAGGQQDLDVAGRNRARCSRSPRRADDPPDQRRRPRPCAPAQAQEREPGLRLAPERLRRAVGLLRLGELAAQPVDLGLLVERRRRGRGFDSRASRSRRSPRLLDRIGPVAVSSRISERCTRQRPVKDAAAAARRTTPPAPPSTRAAAARARTPAGSPRSRAVDEPRDQRRERRRWSPRPSPRRAARAPRDPPVPQQRLALQAPRERDQVRLAEALADRRGLAPRRVARGAPSPASMLARGREAGDSLARRSRGRALEETLRRGSTSRWRGPSRRGTRGGSRARTPTARAFAASPVSRWVAWARSREASMASSSPKRPWHIARRKRSSPESGEARSARTRCIVRIAPGTLLVARSAALEIVGRHRSARAR